MEVRAVAKYLRVSPLKARLVINELRGMSVDDALAQLRCPLGHVAKPVAKLIESAVANAEENFGLSREDLYISKIYADQGPIRKWRRFGARGRFKPIVRRYSHITVVLDERL